MKVLFDALGLPAYGGAKSAALGWIRSIAEQAAQHQFLVVLSQREPLLGGLSNVQQLFAPARGRFRVRLWAQMRVRQIALARRVDLVHFSKNHGCFFMPCPSVITINDLTRLYFPEMFSPVDVFYWRTVQRALLRSMNRVIAISEQTKQDLMRFYHLAPDKIQVIHPGLSPRFQWQHASADASAEVLRKYGIQPPYILSIGGMATHKNVYTALCAFYSLLDRGCLPDHTLVIVGGQFHTHNDQRLFDLASRRNNQQIRFTGIVADDELPLIYSGASLFLYPSLYEGFGIAPLEAMACGVPVLCSRAGSLPEVLGNAAWMVGDPTDVNAFAEGMLQLLTDPRPWEHLRERGLKNAERFSPSQAAQQTLELYEHLVHQGEGILSRELG